MQIYVDKIYGDAFMTDINDIQYCPRKRAYPLS
mgnify:CR=1 FL=1